MKFFRFVLFLVLPLLASSPAFAQGRVFYEPGDHSSGATTSCPPVLASRDGVAHQFPGPALECGWDGTLDWTNPAKTLELELSSMSMKAERLVRGWFRVDANVDTAPGSKMMRLGYGSPNEIIIACQFEGAVPRLWVGVNGRPSFWGGNAPNCRQGWQQLEVYQSPTLIRVWQNDVLLAEWPGPLDVNSMVTWMSQWSNNDGWGHDAMNKVYWQRLEAYTDTGTGGTGSMRDGTMTQGGTPPPPPPPPPTNCIPGTPVLAATETGACVNSSRTITETWTRTGDVPPTNGGLACPPNPYTVTRTEPCTPPPPAETLTAVARVIRCEMAVTLTNATPPYAGARMQLQRRLVGATSWSSHGSVLTAAPYTRTSQVAAGVWEVRGLWTLTGQPSVPTAAVSTTACE